MSRFPGVDALIEAGGRRSTRQDFADRITTKSTQVQGAQEALADNDIVPNTRIAPSPPTGIFIRPRNRGMDVSWAIPPAGDHVAVTEVMLVRTSNAAVTIHKFQASLLGGSINGLDATEYDVSLQHRSKFGQPSGFATPSSKITPTPTIAEQIAADVQVAATQITGQLGEAQVPTITSPEKLAQAVYEAASDAAGKGANLLPYEESNWELYDAGPWPQRGAQSFTGDQRTLNLVTSVSGKIEMNIVAGTAAGVGWPSCFFNTFSRRGTVAEESYIASMVVRNVSGVAGTAQLVVQAASDTAGTGAAGIGSSGGVAIPSDGRDRRVFCKFKASSALPFFRLLEYAMNPGDNLLYRDFQLEKAEPRQTTPSLWKLPAISVGAISAKLVAAWDLTAVRAIIGNLTVESAKILSVAAEKFVGGTIQAQEFILAAGGRFRTANNGTRLDDGGITLLHGADFNTAAYRLDQKITSLADRAAISFYHDTTTGFRGPILRSDGGNTDGTRGAVVLHATYAGSLGAASSARVEVLSLSSGGQVNLYGTVTVLKGLFVDGELRQRNSAGTTVEFPVTSVAASTGAVTFNHGLGIVPFGVFLQFSDAAGLWRPIVDNTNNWRIEVTSTSITVKNLATIPASRPVRGFAFR